jgi:hypothetical protein
MVPSIIRNVSAAPKIPAVTCTPLATLLEVVVLQREEFCDFVRLLTRQLVSR